MFVRKHENITETGSWTVMRLDTHSGTTYTLYYTHIWPLATPVAGPGLTYSKPEQAATARMLP